jgi:hypothetical protein
MRIVDIVARLREFRAHGHSLLLIGIWAILEAATLAWIALMPGAPVYSDSGVGSLRDAVVVTVVLVVFVGVGSLLAWWLAIFSNTVGFALGIVAGLVSFGPKPVGVALLQGAALWLIWSGNIELYVQRGRRRRQVAPPPSY